MPYIITDQPTHKPQAIGTDRDFAVGPLHDSAGAVPTFTGSETLPWNIWRGDGGPAVVSGFASWIDPVAGTVKISITAADTANLLPGLYAIDLSVVSGGQTLGALPPDSFIEFADAATATQPTPGRLLSLVEAKASLDATTGSRGDLGFLLDAASRSIERYLGYAVTFGTYEEFQRPENTRILRLSKAAPVTAISTLEYGKAGSRTPITNYQILGDGSSGEVELYQSFSQGFRYPDRPYAGDARYGEVHAIYTGGFAIGAVPSDLKQAALLTAKAMTDVIKIGAMKSERLGEYGYTLADMPAGIPSAAIALLSPWRRRRFA
jgi:hypothetical protein